MAIFDAKKFRDRAACGCRPGFDDALLGFGTVVALRYGAGELRCWSSSHGWTEAYEGAPSLLGVDQTLRAESGKSSTDGWSAHAVLCCELLLGGKSLPRP